VSFSSRGADAEFAPFGLAKTSAVRPRTAPREDQPAQEQPTDEALMASLCSRGQLAIGCLFHRHARLILEVGRRVLRDSTEAEDLVQEVFLYIFRKHDLYDSSKGSARSWIIQVAYTQAFIRRRQLKSIGYYTPGIADRLLESGSLTSSSAEYDQTVEALFGRSNWKQVLESLTHEQRETLRLHFFEGYTFAEIAEKLGQTYANVRHHHYRALEKLRKYLTANGLSRR